MKTYRYHDFDEHHEPSVKEITAKEILKEYWKLWRAAMVEQYGEGHELITEEHCLQDWVVANWAWEVDDG